MTQSDDRKSEEGVEAHGLSYPVSRLSPPFDLVDLAKEIAKADDLLSIQASGKLQLLAGQIRRLQEEARQLLEETTRNQQLHHAACNFKKKIGRTYHLYRKEDTSLIFSMVAPREWGNTMPYSFVGSFRLENDMTWTEVTQGE